MIFFRWSISFCYFVYNGYSLADFLEYPFLLAQSVFQICLHFWFEKPKTTLSGGQLALGVILYTVLVAILSSPSITPNIMITLLMVSCRVLKQKKRSDLTCKQIHFNRNLHNSLSLLMNINVIGDKIYCYGVSISSVT
jgi:hypothetical protein